MKNTLVGFLFGSFLLMASTFANVPGWLNQLQGRYRVDASELSPHTCALERYNCWRATNMEITVQGDRLVLSQPGYGVTRTIEMFEVDTQDRFSAFRLISQYAHGGVWEAEWVDSRRLPSGLIERTRYRFEPYRHSYVYADEVSGGWKVTYTLDRPGDDLRPAERDEWSLSLRKLR